MSLVFMESFDLIGDDADLADKGFFAQEGSINLTSGINGGGAYELLTSPGNVLSVARPYVLYTTFSFWFKTLTVATGFICIVSDDLTPFDATSATQVQMRLDTASDGKLNLYTGDVAVGFNSGVPLVAADTWHHIEIQLHSASVGNCKVWWDGVVVFDEAGDFLSSTGASSVLLCGDNDSKNSFDDLVIYEDGASQPAANGLHEIEVLLPDGAGTNAQWTGSATDVDDPLGASSDGDSTFINESVVSDKHDFTLDNLSDTPDSVFAIQEVVEARKDDSGAKGATPFIISNGTTSSGSEAFDSQTYSMGLHIVELDPDTASAWTVSAINALQAGIEITS